MTTWKITVGGSSDIKLVTIENVTDYTDYYATLAVIDILTKKPVEGTIVPLLPNIHNGFTVQLLPAQTKNLKEGSYLVALELSKGVDPITYRKEVSWIMEVSESLINV